MSITKASGRMAFIQTVYQMTTKDIIDSLLGNLLDRVCFTGWSIDISPPLLLDEFPGRRTGHDGL
jgi:hypothetical protein